MSARRFSFRWLLCLGALAGCGGPPSVSPPSEGQTAVETGQMVTAFVERAKKGKVTAGETGVLLESLDARAGDQGGAYVELRDAVAQLKTMLEQKKPKAEVDAQLDKVSQQAQALGGIPAAS